MDPLNWFPFNARQVKSVKLPRKAGRSPDSLLLDAEKVLSSCSDSIEGGRLPSKWLSLRSSTSNFDNAPRLCGICCGREEECGGKTNLLKGEKECLCG